jgi:hypothetical protein
MPPKKAVIASPGPTLDRYTQEMLKFRHSILQLYSITANNKIAGGGFSEIFELPHNQLLRIGLIGPYNAGHFPRAVQASREGWARTNKSGVTPRIEYVADLPSNWAEAKSKGVPVKEGMIATVMSRVTDVVPFPDWAKLFASDLKIAQALFTAAAKLEAVGVIHSDANERNVLVRKNGEVVFVDLDDLCQYEGTTEVETFFCKRISGFTPGYCAPELQLPPAKKANLHSYIHSATGRRQSMYAGLMAIVAAAFKQIKPTDMKSAADAPKMLKTPGLKAIAEQIVGPIDQRPKSAKEIVQALSKISQRQRSGSSSSSSSSNSYSAELPQPAPKATLTLKKEKKTKKRKTRPASPCGRGQVVNPHTKRCINVGGKVHKILCTTTEGCP